MCLSGCVSSLTLVIIYCTETALSVTFLLLEKDRANCKDSIANIDREAITTNLVGDMINFIHCHTTHKRCKNISSETCCHQYRMYNTSRRAGESVILFCDINVGPVYFFLQIILVSSKMVSVLFFHFDIP